MTTTDQSPATPLDLAQRLKTLDWRGLTERLDEDGFVQTPPVYDTADCDRLAALFEEGTFRATIDMRRHRFGEGRYRYFERPFPALIEDVRQSFYPPLAALANRWAEQLGEPQRYPTTLDTFLARCHEAGQERPTPLILRYGAGGHNTLHQDIYGDVAFPLQAVTLLSRSDQFTGGEFVLVEQRPRAQSRAHVITLARGGFLIFPTRLRPVLGARGYYRSQMRHGVATVRSGERTTLGVIFHDAR
jgi:hypothetical protein